MQPNDAYVCVSDCLQREAREAGQRRAEQARPRAELRRLLTSGDYSATSHAIAIHAARVRFDRTIRAIGRGAKASRRTPMDATALLEARAELIRLGRDSRRMADANAACPRCAHFTPFFRRLASRLAEVRRRPPGGKTPTPTRPMQVFANKYKKTKVLVA